MKAKFFMAFAALLMWAGAAQAQQKFGYTNVDYILAYMPESKTAQQQLTEYEQQLTNQIQAKYQTLQQKLAELERDYPTLIDAVRADREAEIQQLQASLQQFQGQAEQLLAKKQSDLLQPLYDKIQGAIDEVSKENGYTYVFRSEALLFAPEGDEISEMVFAKLGITPPTQEAATGGH